MKKIVVCTGGYDPVHSGHLAYFKAAKELGNILVVGVNSDAWLTRKKGRYFMPLKERTEIIKNIKGVDFVISFDDSSGNAIDAINMVRQSYPNDVIIFANGGDRTNQNTPEMAIQDPLLQFAFGVGGTNKANSSSWILDEWKAPKTVRSWGYYRVLHEVSGAKVKELTVDPGAKLSMQRHSNRAEFWLVSSGTATVYTVNSKTDLELQGHYAQHEHLHIAQKQWHQLANETSEPLKLIEIQYGTQCIEEDIERQS